MYLDDTLLNAVVGVALNSHSIINTYKKIESIIALLEVEYSKVIVIFEVYIVYFVLTSVGLLIGLIF